jgi:hypothetical protein
MQEFFQAIIENKIVINTQDVTELNLRLRGTNPDKICLDYGKVVFIVDLKTGKMHAGNNEIDLKLPNNFKTDSFRYIAFRRNFIDFGMVGEKEKRYINCIGWQANYNGENFQRILAINENKYDLWVKR